MKERVRGNEYRTTMVCIDAFTDGEWQGRFYNPGLRESVAFQSLSQFLERMEDMLDSFQLPQSYTARRAFTPLHDQTNAAVEDRIQSGQTGTFAVRVLFRQNASWQGSVTWLEGRREESFRSALELIFLINSALRGAE